TCCRILLPARSTLSPYTTLFRSAGLAVVACGVGLIVLGLRQTIRALLDVVLPGHVGSLASLVYRRQHLRKGPRVVAIGGGTGLRSEEHTSELQSRENLVCRLLLE